VAVTSSPKQLKFKAPDIASFSGDVRPGR